MGEITPVCTSFTKGVHRGALRRCSSGVGRQHGPSLRASVSGTHGGTVVACAVCDVVALCPRGHEAVSRGAWLAMGKSLVRLFSCGFWANFGGLHMTTVKCELDRLRFCASSTFGAAKRFFLTTPFSSMTRCLQLATTSGVRTTPTCDL